MTTVKANTERTVYDEASDVLFVGIGESRFTDEDEVAPGIHVLYAYDGGRLDDVVAVEIEYFKERFVDSDEILIPARIPFRLAVPAIA